MSPEWLAVMFEAERKKRQDAELAKAGKYRALLEAVRHYHEVKHSSHYLYAKARQMGYTTLNDAEIALWKAMRDCEG